MKNEILENKNYQTSVIIHADSKTVFKALTKDISSWWGQMDQQVDREGAIFTVSWGEPWYKFKVIDYLPNTYLRWECIDANQIIGNLEGVQKEWVGTQLEWRIEPAENLMSKVTFLHRGLVPEFICYDVCSNAWDRFIGDALKKYIESKRID